MGCYIYQSGLGAFYYVDVNANRRMSMPACRENFEFLRDIFISIDPEASTCKSGELAVPVEWQMPNFTGKHRRDNASRREHDVERKMYLALFQSERFRQFHLNVVEKGDNKFLPKTIDLLYAITEIKNNLDVEGYDSGAGEVLVVKSVKGFKLARFFGTSPSEEILLTVPVEKIDRIEATPDWAKVYFNHNVFWMTSESYGKCEDDGKSVTLQTVGIRPIESPRFKQ